MLFYSIQEVCLIVAAATIVDRIIGDPRWIPHPVIMIGRLISMLESRLHADHSKRMQASSPKVQRVKGIALTITTVSVAFAACWGVVAICTWAHPWLGYAAAVWLVSTTIAVKGLKQAAEEVYLPLIQGRIGEAREAVGRIVGRDTGHLDEPGVTRAAVETTAENTVDAYLSPIFWALIGGAPLAMLYRAANTLDSMVGYRNEKYRYFGWASARFDDVLNYIPARITGLLLVFVCTLDKHLSGRKAARSIWHFAKRHPSPNSGIPEAAAAGALGVELGGENFYGGVLHERARLGWPSRPLRAEDIRSVERLLVRSSYCVTGGLVLIWAVLTYAV